MLPAGHITETTIGELGKLLGADDVVIDGGNTFWQDDIRRAKTQFSRANFIMFNFKSGLKKKKDEAEFF